MNTKSFNKSFDISNTVNDETNDWYQLLEITGKSQIKSPPLPSIVGYFFSQNRNKNSRIKSLADLHKISEKKVEEFLENLNEITSNTLNQLTNESDHNADLRKDIGISVENDDFINHINTNESDINENAILSPPMIKVNSKKIVRRLFKIIP